MAKSNKAIAGPDTGEVAIDPNEFFLMDVDVGEKEPLRFKITDPVAGRELVEEIVKKGTFSRSIEGGMQLYPVKSAKLTGPYTVTEVASDV